MGCSMPGFAFLHYCTEFDQTHIHWVSDAILPFHSLSPVSPPTLNLSQHQGLFQSRLFASGGQSIGDSVSPSNEYSRLMSFQFSCKVMGNSLWPPRTVTHQASLSITNSRSLLKLMSIQSVMPSSHLIFCLPLLLLSIFPSIRVFFPKESVLGIRWPKYWSFSFSKCPSNEYSGLISFTID